MFNQLRTITFGRDGEERYGNGVKMIVRIIRRRDGDDDDENAERRVEEGWRVNRG